MTSPHIELGNTMSDIGSGVSSFADSLVAARQRAQTIALNQALANSKIGLEDSQRGHFDAQTGLVQQQTDSAKALLPGQLDEMSGKSAQSHALADDAAAQALERQQEGMPADEFDEQRLHTVDNKYGPGSLKGMSKGQANKHILALLQARATAARLQSIQDRFEGRGTIAYDSNGNGQQVFPNQPGGGNVQPIGGVAKPLQVGERKEAGASAAALADHQVLSHIDHTYPHASDEVAKAISLPNFGRLVVIPGSHDSISDILEQFRLMGASPEAQEYLKTMFDFVGIVGPSRYGVRGMQTPRGLQQIWSDFGAGQFGLGQKGKEAAQHNRMNAIKQLQIQAGPRAVEQSQRVMNTPDAANPVAPPNKYFNKYGITPPGGE